MHLEKRRVEAILVHQVTDWVSGAPFFLDPLPDYRLRETERAPSPKSPSSRSLTALSLVRVA